MAYNAMDLVAQAKQSITEVSANEAQPNISQMLVLDVREPGEFAQGHLPGAINLPRGLLEFKINDHPAFNGKQGAEILVYCQAGGRSALATETLQKMGYQKPISMAGGFKSWIDNGFEITKAPNVC